MMLCKHTKWSVFVCAVFFALISCKKEKPENDAINTGDAGFSEAYVEIQPQSWPSGGGLDLGLNGNGSVGQLDVHPEFNWDLKVMAYRTNQGGRPAIFLAGNTGTTEKALAVNVTQHFGIGTGLDGFNAFTAVSAAMIDSLRADGVFTFDPLVDVDQNGEPDAALLLAQYNNLVIGNSVVDLGESEAPVFLVKDLEGNYHKFQHVRRENGGRVFLRWDAFDPSQIAQ